MSDPNEIPLKDLIEETFNPLFEDMGVLERLSPICIPDDNNYAKDTMPELTMETNSFDQLIENENSVTNDSISNELPATSKNLQELQKMITKITEEIDAAEAADYLQNQKQHLMGKEEETLIAVRSLIESESPESCSLDNEECTTVE